MLTKAISRHLALSASIILAVSACASQPRITSKHDPEVDFSQFRTYDFFNPMSIEDPKYSTILGGKFRKAISREMEARGYVRSEEPDLMINVSAQLQEKLRVTETPAPYRAGGYYGYRRGFYDPWAGYGWDTQTNVEQYTEGTINVDLVDTARQRMVWEGVAIGRLRDNRSSEQISAAIDDGVARMFETYSFRAGE